MQKPQSWMQKPQIWMQKNAHLETEMSVWEELGNIGKETKQKEPTNGTCFITAISQRSGCNHQETNINTTH